MPALHFLVFPAAGAEDEVVEEAAVVEIDEDGDPDGGEAPVGAVIDLGEEGEEGEDDEDAEDDSGDGGDHGEDGVACAAEGGGLDDVDGEAGLGESGEDEGEDAYGDDGFGIDEELEHEVG